MSVVGVTLLHQKSLFIMRKDQVNHCMCWIDYTQNR